LNVTAQLPYVPAPLGLAERDGGRGRRGRLHDAGAFGLVRRRAPALRRWDYFEWRQAQRYSRRHEHAQVHGNLSPGDRQPCGDGGRSSLRSPVRGSRSTMRRRRSPSDNLLRTLDMKHNVVSCGRRARGLPGTNPAIARSAGGFGIAFRPTWRHPVVDRLLQPRPHTGIRTAPGSSRRSPAAGRFGQLQDPVVRDTGFPAVYDTDGNPARLPGRGGRGQTPGDRSNSEHPGSGSRSPSWAVTTRPVARLLRRHSERQHPHPGGGDRPEHGVHHRRVPGPGQQPHHRTIWQYLGDGNQRDTHAPIAPGSSPSNSNAGGQPATPTRSPRRTEAGSFCAAIGVDRCQALGTRGLPQTGGYGVRAPVCRPGIGCRLASTHDRQVMNDSAGGCSDMP